MNRRGRAHHRTDPERGSTLFILAASLFVLLGMGALAVDLASLYVARAQVQRAADAAALAGAKYFVESGCVTLTSCAGGFLTTAEARATLSAGQNAANQQALTVSSFSFTDQPQNPQLTVTLQAQNFHLYFAGAIGISAAPQISATATAEAWNPSGGNSSTTYCTSCVRPLLIANCDQNFTGPDVNLLCTVGNATAPTQAYLINPNNSYSVDNQNCWPNGVIGEPITIPVATATLPLGTPPTTLYGALDVDNPGTVNFFDYQSAIPICSTSQLANPMTTCGLYNNVNVLPIAPTPSVLSQSTINGVDSLLHLAPNTTGIVNQDTIVTGSCPVQIQAGAANPLVAQGVVGVGQDVSTSDSIITAYIFDRLNPLSTGLTYDNTGVSDSPQSVLIVGFAQIFVTQVDANGNIYGNILSVAGCGNNLGAACGQGAGNLQSINSPTTLPVRLIQQGAGN